MAPSIGIITLAYKFNRFIVSHGWQVCREYPCFSSKDLTWDVTANFGRQTSIIDAVQGGTIRTPLTGAAGSTSLVLSAGRKIGEIYGYKALTSVSQLRTDKTPFIADPADQEIMRSWMAG